MLLGNYVCIYSGSSLMLLFRFRGILTSKRLARSAPTEQLNILAI